MKCAMCACVCVCVPSVAVSVCSLSLCVCVFWGCCRSVLIMLVVLWGQLRCSGTKWAGQEVLLLLSVVSGLGGDCGPRLMSLAKSQIAVHELFMFMQMSPVQQEHCHRHRRCCRLVRRCRLVVGAWSMEDAAGRLMGRIRNVLWVNWPFVWQRRKMHSKVYTERP